MELAGIYSVAVRQPLALLYGGLPGEPALGPPAFMHRFSGMNIPVAPITHHWLDSTHITYGVVTAGAVFGSGQGRGLGFPRPRARREPLGHRAAEARFRTPSASRVNPTDRWALQASYGRHHEPRAARTRRGPGPHDRLGMYDGTWGDTGRWEGMLAWGQTATGRAHTLDAFTAEAARSAATAIRCSARRGVRRMSSSSSRTRAPGRFRRRRAHGRLPLRLLATEHASIGWRRLGHAHLRPHLHDSYGKTPLSALVFLRAAVH